MIPRRALLGLGAALALPGCALRPTLENAPPVALPDTRQIDLAAGGHTHRIMLAVPPAPPPAQGWPVLYVLDGDLLFAPTAQLMRNRFARGPGVPTQGAVVVGLGYAGGQVLDLDARTYDYTPPAPGPATDERGRREGGADAFLDFIDATVRREQLVKLDHLPFLARIPSAPADLQPGQRLRLVLENIDLLGPEAELRFVELLTAPAACPVEEDAEESPA